MNKLGGLRHSCFPVNFQTLFTEHLRLVTSVFQLIDLKPDILTLNIKIQIQYFRNTFVVFSLR